MSLQAYTALCSVITNTALLTLHQTDLTHHDRRLLMGEAEIAVPARFAWIVNDAASHMICDYADAYTHKMFADSFNPTTGSARSIKDEFYLWNGETLSKTDHVTMFATLAEWRAELARAA